MKIISIKRIKKIIGHVPVPIVSPLENHMINQVQDFVNLKKYRKIK